jgi:hypothetical protein
MIFWLLGFGNRSLRRVGSTPLHLEVLAWSLDPGTGLHDLVRPWVLSVTSGKFQDNLWNYAAVVSFHIISSVLFTSHLWFDVVWFKLLKVLLSKSRHRGWKRIVEIEVTSFSETSVSSCEIVRCHYSEENSHEIPSRLDYLKSGVCWGCDMDWLPHTKFMSVTLAEFVFSARGETDLFFTSRSPWPHSRLRYKVPVNMYFIQFEVLYWRTSRNILKPRASVSCYTFE